MLVGRFRRLREGGGKEMYTEGEAGSDRGRGKVKQRHKVRQRDR